MPGQDFPDIKCTASALSGNCYYHNIPFYNRLCKLLHPNCLFINVYAVKQGHASSSLAGRRHATNHNALIIRHHSIISVDLRPFFSHKSTLNFITA